MGPTLLGPLIAWIWLEIESLPSQPGAAGLESTVRKTVSVSLEVPEFADVRVLVLRCCGSGLLSSVVLSFVVGRDRQPRVKVGDGVVEAVPDRSH